jgi:flagellar hook-associated protein 3 FlgL
MRVSTIHLENKGISGVMDAQARLSKTQLQLATGKRIVNPSDDPADATRVLDLQKSQERTAQYQDNIILAENRLTREDSALTAMVDSLQRTRELAVQALNGTMGPDNRDSLAGEIRQRLDELLGLANTKDASGEYIFGGFQVRNPPFDGDPFAATGATFSYNGDDGQRHSQISASRTLPIGDPGNELLMGISDGNGGRSDILNEIYRFATNLESNTPNRDVLDRIDESLDSITSVQAKVGSRLNVIDSQKLINEDHILNLKSAISDLQDLDYAEAISSMNLQLTGLQAAQQAYTKVKGLSLFNFL